MIQRLVHATKDEFLDVAAALLVQEVGDTLTSWVVRRGVDETKGNR